MQWLKKSGRLPSFTTQEYLDEIITLMNYKEDNITLKEENITLKEENMMLKNYKAKIEELEAENFALKELRTTNQSEGKTCR